MAGRPLADRTCNVVLAGPVGSCALDASSLQHPQATRRLSWPVRRLAFVQLAGHFIRQPGLRRQLQSAPLTFCFPPRADPDGAGRVERVKTKRQKQSEASIEQLPPPNVKMISYSLIFIACYCSLFFYLPLFSNSAYQADFWAQSVRHLTLIYVTSHLSNFIWRQKIVSSSCRASPPIEIQLARKMINLALCEGPKTAH